MNAITRQLKRIGSKNKLLAGILVALAILLTGIVGLAPTPDKKEVLETAWPVTTMPAKAQRLSPELSLYGRVESPRQSSLTAAVTAFVEDVAVLEGTWVNAGQTLIQLDPIDASLQVERRQADEIEARANLETLKLKVAENQRILIHEKNLSELAEAKSKRHEQLRQQRSISEETLNAVSREANRQAISLSRQEGLVNDAKNQLARAEANLKRANAMLREAEVKLGRTRIEAPFAGRVTSVSVSKGELVQPGSVMVEMYDTTQMVIRTQIPGSNLAAVKQAISAGEQLSAHITLRDQILEAKLTRLSGEVSRGRSSVDGLFTVSGDVPLELGRAVQLRLSLPSIEDSILVPVQSMYGHDRVFIVAGERLLGIEVERVGQLTDEAGHLNILIRSPEIGPSVPIITSQLSNAITGLKVTTSENMPELAGLDYKSIKSRD